MGTIRTKDEQRARERLYRKRTNEKVKEKHRRYYEANQNKCAASRRNRTISGGDVGRIYTEEQRIRHNVTTREWRTRNLDEERAKAAVRGKSRNKDLANLRQRARRHGVTLSQFLDACPSGYAPRKKTKP